MAFIDLDALKGKAQGLVQAGVTKSKQLGELAKLNLSVAQEEEAIRKAYVEVGKLYYAEKGMAPDPEFVALCEKITASKVTIEELKAHIEELKAAGAAEEPEVAPVAEEETVLPPLEVPEEPETPPEE